MGGEARSKKRSASAVGEILSAHTRWPKSLCGNKRCRYLILFLKMLDRLTKVAR